MMLTTMAAMLMVTVKTISVMTILDLTRLCYLDTVPTIGLKNRGVSTTDPRHSNSS